MTLRRGSLTLCTVGTWGQVVFVVETVLCIEGRLSAPRFYLLGARHDNQKCFQTLLSVPLVAMRPTGLAIIASKYKHHFIVTYYFLLEHTFHQGGILSGLFIGSSPGTGRGPGTNWVSSSYLLNNRRRHWHFWGLPRPEHTAKPFLCAVPFKLHGSTVRHLQCSSLRVESEFVGALRGSGAGQGHTPGHCRARIHPLSRQHLGSVLVSTLIGQWGPVQDEIT